MASSESLRGKIADLNQERAKIERRIAEAQKQRSKYDADASKYESSAQSASTDSTRRSRQRSAESARQRAQKESGKLADLYTQRSRNSEREAQSQKDLSRALKNEDDSKRRAEQRVSRERDNEAKREAARQRARERANVAQISELRDTLARITAPKAEMLRIVYATAAPEGDLRLDKEIRRVRQAVRSSTHRELVEIHVLTAATPGDLLDALVQHRPHVVHFSGHANQDALLFDADTDVENEGRHVSASVFARALRSVDQPPTVVVLNACDSAAQLSQLTEGIPLAIGMRASIMDVDAITFSTRFYSTLAEGQSVEAALAVAQIDMEMNGLEGHDLPEICAADGIDPSQVALVKPPSSLQP